MRAKKSQYYSLDAILAYNAHYNVIIGERSNGKTYACLSYALKRYIDTGEQCALLRRWADDFRGKRALQMWTALVADGLVTKWTGGKWDYVHYYSGAWYLARDGKDGDRETDKTPFAYRFALTDMEHDKSTSYPNITTVIFDEFIASGTYKTYLPDEFVLFCNVLSTIIRQRDGIRVFLIGNTISQQCPYFAEMGLTNIKKMARGTIDVYSYGQSDLRVAVEFSDFPGKRKSSDVYFAFDNPKLSMITGSGEVWQLGMYPHAPCKWRPADVAMSYFVLFDGEMLQCDVVALPSGPFIFVHRKTGPIKKPDRDLIYSVDYDPRPNWRRNLLKPVLPVEQKIIALHRADKVFYQDNVVGELYNAFLDWCK